MNHPLIDKLEKLEKGAKETSYGSRASLVFSAKLKDELLNNHKKLLQAIRVLEEMGMFYATKSEPDYAGANSDGSPKCVMHTPWDNGKTAFKALLNVKEILG